MKESPESLLIEAPPGTITCARLVGVEEGVPVLAPDTPEFVPGNAQYVLLARLAPAAAPRRLRIAWPGQPKVNPPGFDYPHNESFAAVLDRVLFTSSDWTGWTPLEAARIGPDRVECAAPAGGEPLWLSAGIPYFQRDLDALLADRAVLDGWRVEVIGTSLEGRAVHGFFRPAAGCAAGRVFLLLGGQH